VTTTDTAQDFGFHDLVQVIWTDHAFNRGPRSEHDQTLIRFVTIGYLLDDVVKGMVQVAQSYNLTNDEYEDILVLDERSVVAVRGLKPEGA
jgi:hypothetical protein